MSLIKCPECEKVFSDRAAHCPQCGLPTSEALKAIIGEAAEPTPAGAAPQPAPTVPNYTTPSTPPQPKKPGNAMLYVLVCVVIALAVILIAIFIHDKFGSAEEPVDSADSVAAMQTYPADTVAASIEPFEPKTTPVVTPIIEEPEPEILPDGSETGEIEATTPPVHQPTEPDTHVVEPEPQPTEPTQPTE